MTAGTDDSAARGTDAGAIVTGSTRGIARRLVAEAAAVVATGTHRTADGGRSAVMQADRLPDARVRREAKR